MSGANDTSASESGSGRTLIDGVLVLGLLGVLLSIAWFAANTANLDSRRRVVEKEAKRLYSGLANYYDHNGEFPNSYAKPAFETETTEPLRSRGYYEGQVTAALVGGKIDAYESPDDKGLNQEFWLELTLREDPSTRYVVARSDDAPAAGGRWIDGVFVVRDGALEPLR